MAITFVSSTGNDDNASTSLSVSDPATTQENDLYIAVCHVIEDAATGNWSTPSGWTKLAEEYTSTGGTGDVTTAIFYRFRGGTAVGSTLFDYGVANAAIAVNIAAYRGVDTTTPFDVTYSSGSHYAHATDSATGGTAAAITTATNDAAVILVSSSNGTITPH
jgi:MSHA biogenesis protein MshQ